MTDPIVSLDTDRLSVEPGGQVSVTVKITNPGSIVEGYRIEVVGEGVSEWGQAVPPEISVYPKQDATAVVVFGPPGGTGAPGGTWPFGIRVRSTEDEDASAVAEGDLEIGKVFGLQAKLVPVNSSGRWRGQHVITVSNWGNSPAKLRLTASNPDEALGFLIRPDVVDLPLGGTANARIWVRTKKPFLRGSPVRIPFTVTGEREDAAPQQGPTQPYLTSPDRPSVDGALNQKPIVSKGAVMVLALSLLAVGGGVAYALTRPKPAQATFQEFGPPGQPKNVKVTAVGPDAAKVAWEPVDNVQTYTVVQDENGAQSESKSVPSTDNQATRTGLPPGSKVCFKVQAVRGALPGPFSEAACAQLPAPTQTASPSAGNSPPPSSGAPVSPSSGVSSPPPDGGAGGGGAGGGGGTGGGGTGGGGGQGGPSSSQPTSPSDGQGGGGTGQGGTNPAFKGQWFAATYWPVANSVADVDKLEAELKAQGLPAGQAISTAYPNVTVPIRVESKILFAGPYPDAGQATAACTPFKKVAKSCQPLQLDP